MNRKIEFNFTYKLPQRNISDHQQLIDYIFEEKTDNLLFS